MTFIVKLSININVIDYKCIYIVYLKLTRYMKRYLRRCVIKHVTAQLADPCLFKIAVGCLTNYTVIEMSKSMSFNKIFNIIYKSNPKTNVQPTLAEKVSEMDQDIITH